MNNGATTTWVPLLISWAVSAQALLTAVSIRLGYEVARRRFERKADAP